MSDISVTIEVNKALERCLEILRGAIGQLAQGEQKEKAEAALDYMTRSFAGESLPEETECKPGSWLVP